MSVDARPYFVPSETAVTWSPWMLRGGDGWVELPDVADGWHPGVDLTVAREFQIDLERLQSDTGCTVSDLLITLRWISSTTQMLECVAPMAVPPSGAGRIEALVPGDRIGGALTLRTAVVFGGGERRGPIGAAHIAGSILTDHSHTILLEQDSRMFPMQMVDFAATPYSPTASWHLEIDDADLSRPYLAAFMLLINSRDTVLRSAIEQQVKDDAATLLFEGLEEQVARLLLEVAVDQHEEVMAADWPTDSVGDVLKRTLVHSGLDAAATRDMAVADRCTLIEGMVRKAGHGRLFR
jgi:hypothetical protein